MTKWILYSAGYDSTYLVDKIAKETPRNEKIILLMIGFKIANNDIYNSQMEKTNKFLEYLNKTNDVTLKTIFIDTELTPYSYGWTQQLWWAIYSLDYVCNKDTIYFGYHMGDQYWTIEREIRDIINAVKSIHRIEFNVEYPLKYISKDIIYEYVVNNNLLEHVITCSNPKKIKNKYKECGKCEKCQEIQTAKYALKLSKECDICERATC